MVFSNFYSQLCELFTLNSLLEESRVFPLEYFCHTQYQCTYIK